MYFYRCHARIALAIGQARKSKEGESCSWGRGILFAGFAKQSETFGKYYEFRNLASTYGRNSTIAGWHSWLTTHKVIFNAKIVPDDVDIGKEKYIFAYVITFDYDETHINGLSFSTWGDAKNINSKKCYVGRMHASVPPLGYSKSCSAGQYVTFTRRCLDDSITADNFSWYNTVNYDGTGGSCRAPGGNVEASKLVPVFKSYVVKVDEQCNAFSFDRDKPIRKPDSTGRYRHMGLRAEWGDGQPTISADGSAVAFWSNKSSDSATTTNNCAGFESKDNATIGDDASRVRLCYLDSSHQKCASIAKLPPPSDPWDFQGNAYFYKQDNGNLAIFTSDSSGLFLSDLVTGQRTKLLFGFGGYPISP